MSVVGQTVFITKYAFTSGILTAKVTVVHDTGVTVEWKGGLNNSNYFSNNVVFFHVEDAQAEVKKQAARKIKSMEKSIKKLATLAADGTRVKDQKDE